jgi:hypothetical protein
MRPTIDKTVTNLRLGTKKSPASHEGFLKIQSKTIQRVSAPDHQLQTISGTGL